MVPEEDTEMDEFNEMFGLTDLAKSQELHCLLLMRQQRYRKKSIKLQMN